MRKAWATVDLINATVNSWFWVRREATGGAGWGAGAAVGILMQSRPFFSMGFFPTQ